MARQLRLDDVDRRLMELLRKDGRMSSRDLARALDLGEETVELRLRRLAESGALRVAAVMDIDSAGYDFLVTLWIEVEGRGAKEVARDVAAVPNIIAASVVSGQYDIFAIIVASCREQLARLVGQQLAGIPGVRRIASAAALEVLAYDTGYGPIGKASTAPTPEGLRHVSDLVDAVDWRIIDVLKVDARTGCREIARQLGLSQAAVRARVRRLEERGIIRTAAVADIISLGKVASAHVGLSVDRQEIYPVAQALAAMEGITFVAITLGEFDVVCVVLVETREELMEMLNERIGRIPGVRRMEPTEALYPVKFTPSIFSRPQAPPAAPPLTALPA